ncbi:hypothetical protein [Trinickia sp. Y13]|uniref:hypothetical protein n=1 Tax=Trinickia sp. Y13 TaxID=2917807 RepID=UPI0024053277|nr:hypothetical protein [Trinickia sp. Y13]MDG0024936.1 hypothetical protein [Trinickia sp. Y13]
MGEAKRRGTRECRVAQAIQKNARASINLPNMQGPFARELARSGARFLVIGGKALQSVGMERETVDLDIWVARDEKTVERVFATLKKVCGAPDIFLERLRSENVRVAIPSEHNPEIDILTSIGDLSFDEVYGAANEVTWQLTALRVPSVGDQIRIKEIAVASTEARIVAGEWIDAGVEEARRVIARDRQDIDFLRELQR